MTLDQTTTRELRRKEERIFDLLLQRNPDVDKIGKLVDELASLPGAAEVCDLGALYGEWAATLANDRRFEEAIAVTHKAREHGWRCVPDCRANIAGYHLQLGPPSATVTAAEWPSLSLANTSGAVSRHPLRIENSFDEAGARFPNAELIHCESPLTTQHLEQGRIMRHATAAKWSVNTVTESDRSENEALIDVDMYWHEWDTLLEHVFVFDDIRERIRKARVVDGWRTVRLTVYGKLELQGSADKKS